MKWTDLTWRDKIAVLIISHATYRLCYARNTWRIVLVDYDLPGAKETYGYQLKKAFFGFEIAYCDVLFELGKSISDGYITDG